MPYAAINDSTSAWLLPSAERTVLNCAISFEHAASYSLVSTASRWKACAGAEQKRARDRATGQSGGQARSWEQPALPTLPRADKHRAKSVSPRCAVALEHGAARGAPRLPNCRQACLLLATHLLELFSALEDGEEVGGVLKVLPLGLVRPQAHLAVRCSGRSARTEGHPPERAPPGPLFPSPSPRVPRATQPRLPAGWGCV